MAFLGVLMQTHDVGAQGKFDRFQRAAISLCYSFFLSGARALCLCLCICVCLYRSRSRARALALSLSLLLSRELSLSPPLSAPAGVSIRVRALTRRYADCVAAPQRPNFVKANSAHRPLIASKEVAIRATVA